jgi:hypothetical protein
MEERIAKRVEEMVATLHNQFQNSHSGAGQGDLKTMVQKPMLVEQVLGLLRRNLPSLIFRGMMDRKIPLVGYGEQFFNFQNTSEEEKLALTAYHLEGEAQLWYQQFKENEEEQTWEAMKDGLHIHYGPMQSENFFGDLTKLRQMETVPNLAHHLNFRR